jgi:DNA-binding winged helix-turn-helix (wHTH) protein
MLTKRRIYEFDDFRVDTGQFVLSRAGQAEPITPTVFRILQILLEHAGEVVAKEELMKYVWPDSFVEEGNLNRNVSTLRKALDEKPSDHRYIETIPKIGYRFIAPVRTADYQPPAGITRKATTRSATAIVGREPERDMLRRAYEQAEHGHGSMVCIAADTGLGKTALVDYFLDDLLNEGRTFHLARARCSESLTDTEPFIPWMESLTALAEQDGIKDVMLKTAPTWHREIMHAGSAGPRKMKRELVDLCKQVSTAHPLVVMIDDLQWADVGSIDLLAFLANRLESSRILVIVCYRLLDMKVRNHPFLQVRSSLLSRGACTEIQLATLKRKHVEQYLAMDQPNGKFGPDYAGQLYSKSDGNPLFIRELSRGPILASDSIRHMIQAKLDRLHDTHHQLLVTASVQGREFDTAVLAATMHMAPQDVEEALQELDDVHGLVHRMREEQLSDGKFTVRYRFVYELYQEACYSSLAPTRKASLSSSLAEAFLAYYGN